MMCCSCHVAHGWAPVAASAMPRSAASRKSRTRSSRWWARASANVLPFGERISISEEMSSPAARSPMASSSRAASYSSSKRWTSESDAGSRIWNSSSMPTVKSVEASKTSRARGISSIALKPREALRQVEIKRVEQIDGGARGVDGHVRRNLHQRLGVVEDDLHPRLDEVVGHALGRLGRHGKHADDDVLLGDHLVEVVVRPHAQARLVPDRLTDLAGVGVEDRHDAEPVVGEDVRAGDGLTEVAGPEQRDVVLAARPQDLADLRHQRVDVVTHAA